MYMLECSLKMLKRIHVNLYNDWNRLRPPTEPSKIEKSMFLILQVNIEYKVAKYLPKNLKKINTCVFEITEHKSDFYLYPQ